MGAVLPVHGAGVDQPHVRVVHQRGRIGAGARPLLPDVLPPEFAQVVVDERRQALERRLVAASPRFEQCCYFGDGMHLEYDTVVACSCRCSRFVFAKRFEKLRET